MTPQPDTPLARARAAAERRLSAAEFDAYVTAPITEAERQDVLDQIRWFTTRYPTGAERLAYVRRAYARWTRSLTSSD